jgi:site-specific recombinase XerD
MSTEPLLRFGQYLRASDKSEKTIQACLRDLRRFSECFQSNNSDQMTPERITPTDMKEYKVHLLQVKHFKPSYPTATQSWLGLA